jgi:hypothetical protein
MGAPSSCTANTTLASMRNLLLITTFTKAIPMPLGK